MKLIIGSDHPGFEVKNDLSTFLSEMGHDVLDAGTDSPESCDYPKFAFKVARAVSRGECQAGILICGPGIGMSIAANRMKGIRAALCHSLETAELARQHNDANVLCMGARVLDAGLIREIAALFLKTDFDGGRHQRRLDLIDDEDI